MECHYYGFRGRPIHFILTQPKELGGILIFLVRKLRLRNLSNFLQVMKLVYKLGFEHRFFDFKSIPSHPLYLCFNMVANICWRSRELQLSSTAARNKARNTMGHPVELTEQAHTLGPSISIKVSLGHSLTKLHCPRLKVDLT